MQFTLPKLKVFFWWYVSVLFFGFLLSTHPFLFSPFLFLTCQVRTRRRLRRVKNFAPSNPHNSFLSSLLTRFSRRDSGVFLASFWGVVLRHSLMEAFSWCPFAKICGVLLWRPFVTFFCGVLSWLRFLVFLLWRLSAVRFCWLPHSRAVCQRLIYCGVSVVDSLWVDGVVTSRRLCVACQEHFCTAIVLFSRRPNGVRLWHLSVQF